MMGIHEEAKKLTIRYLSQSRSSSERMGRIRMFLRRSGSRELREAAAKMEWPSKFRQLLTNDWEEAFVVRGRDVFLRESTSVGPGGVSNVTEDVGWRDSDDFEAPTLGQTQEVVRTDEAMPLWPERYQLISLLDANDWFEFMESTIGELSSKPKVQAQYGSMGGDVEHPLVVLRNDLSSVMNVDVHGLSPSDIGEVWEQLIDIYEECELSGCPVWGVWRTKRPAQSDDFEINGAPVKMVVPAEGLTNIHQYTRVPSRLEWDVLPIDQEGVRFYMAVASVKEVDAVSMVPQLPSILNCLDASERVIHPNLAQNQWQRQLNVSRALAIKNFASNNHNVIANTPILFVEKGGHVRFEGRKMFIDMHWLQRVGPGEYRDVGSDLIDHRPIWLIDGQHRIRGSARSPRGMNLQVPLIIFPSDFQMMRAAKVFAEINTLQEGLGELHTLFMQHRFHIPSPRAKRDFQVDEEGEPSSGNSRANHLSYEIAAAFCSNSRSPLYKRIRFLEQNDSIIPVIKANQWLDFSRGWFTEIYDEASGYSKAMMTSELHNYFMAICQLTKRAYPGKPGLKMPPYHGAKSIIEKISNFPVLLKVFKTVRTKAEFESPVETGDVISMQTFLKVLQPWRNVDWHDDNLEDFLRGGGEAGRTHLKVWLEDALLSDEAHSKSLIHNEEIASVPGQGLFAKPDNPNIVIHGDGWVHRPGQVLKFNCERPINAFYTCVWNVYSNNSYSGAESLDEHQKEIKSKADVNTGIAELTLPFESWMLNAKQIKIRASWSNKAQGRGEDIVTLKS